jgi:hypothetical protein
MSKAHSCFVVFNELPPIDLSSVQLAVLLLLVEIYIFLPGFTTILEPSANIVDNGFSVERKEKASPYTLA